MFSKSIFKLAGSLMLAVVVALPSAALANVKLKADLGARVIHSGDPGRIYLRLSLQSILDADSSNRAPVNVALVLDRSGSMKGKRLEAAQRAAKMALNRLTSNDIISLVTYNHGVETVQPAATVVDFEELKGRIDALTAKGRTALYDGVVEGAREVREFLSEDNISRVILLSDGRANVGPSTPNALADLGVKLGNEGISVSTIGLGLQYNEDLMSRLALSSDGNHAFAETPRDLVKIFNSEFGDVLSVAATDVTITIECFAGFKPVRVLGRDAKIENNQIEMRLNQLYGAQEKYLIVELDASAATDLSQNRTQVADVRVDYNDLGKRARSVVNKTVEAEISSDLSKSRTSINKSVMTQVTTLIATEKNEQAVNLRDRGDIKGAQKILQDNAAFLKEKASEYGAKALNELEMKNRTQAENLDEENWAKTRKSMRYNQHRSKVQQSY